MIFEFLLVEVHVVGGFQQEVVAEARRHALDLVRPSDLEDMSDGRIESKRGSNAEAKQVHTRHTRDRQQNGGERRKQILSVISSHYNEALESEARFFRRVPRGGGEVMAG